MIVDIYSMHFGGRRISRAITQRPASSRILSRSSTETDSMKFGALWATQSHIRPQRNGIVVNKWANLNKEMKTMKLESQTSSE